MIHTLAGFSAHDKRHFEQTAAVQLQANQFTRP
jgi:hypothetical protein